jgi:hypothetical protein
LVALRFTLPTVSPRFSAQHTTAPWLPQVDRTSHAVTACPHAIETRPFCCAVRTSAFAHRA